MKLMTKGVQRQASRGTLSRDQAVQCVGAIERPDVTRAGWRLTPQGRDAAGRPCWSLTLRIHRPDDGADGAPIVIPLLSYLPLRLAELQTLADTLATVVADLRETHPATPRAS
jgi:hypothetical protein